MSLDKTQLQKELDKAKIGLLQNKGNGKGSAFISTILFSLKFSWDESIPTACTDGLTLKISPQFFESLTKDERVFLLAHEAWHVAFQHMLRLNKQKEDNFYVWNMATDHYINNMLIQAGYTMIEGGLADNKYKDQSEWSSDKIFDDLMKDPENQNKGKDGFDMSNSNLDGEGKKLSQEDADAIKRKIEETLVKASVRAKMAKEYGDIPSDIVIKLEELLNPKLPWNVILQKFMNDFAKEDYSFRRPNRRFMGGSVIMPSLHSESLGHIACAVDTSCSVTDEQFNMFRTELADIKKRLKPKLMTITDFDTEIRAVHKLSPQDNIENVHFSGRGGTNMHPVFGYYTEPQNKPQVLIMFSDMECSAITEDPGFPVIWIKLDGYGFTPTFGTVIDLPEG